MGQVTDEPYARMEGDPLNAKPVFNRTDMDPIMVQMMALDAKEHAFTIERETIQTGRTFSSEAFDAYLESIKMFVASRLMRHWEDTGEPPTLMNVMISTEVH